MNDYIIRLLELHLKSLWLTVINRRLDKCMKMKTKLCKCIDAHNLYVDNYNEVFHEDMAHIDLSTCFSDAK